MKTMKVKPWGQGQGDHVVINAEDFDPSFHKSLDEPDAPQDSGKPMKVDELKQALSAAGVSIPEGSKKEDLQALFDKHVGQS